MAWVLVGLHRKDGMKNKVMVEVGNLEKLKDAIAAFEPWDSNGTAEHTRLLRSQATRLLVDLAKRVVAEEERVLAAIAAPSDYERY